MKKPWIAAVSLCACALPAWGCSHTSGEPYNPARVAKAGDPAPVARQRMGKPLRAMPYVPTAFDKAPASCASPAESWTYAYSDLPEIDCFTTVWVDDGNQVCAVVDKRRGDCGWSDR